MLGNRYVVAKRKVRLERIEECGLSVGVFQNPTKITDQTIRYKDLALGKGRESFGTAIDMVGFLYSWGDNSQGQLGLGDFTSRKALGKI